MMELCKWHLVRMEEMSTGQGGAVVYSFIRHGEVPVKESPQNGLETLTLLHYLCILMVTDCHEIG